MVVEVQRSGSPVVVAGVADEFVLQLAEEAEAKARGVSARTAMADDVGRRGHQAPACPRRPRRWRSCGSRRGEPLVNDAAARFDAEEQAAAEDVAKEGWGVRLDDYSGPIWAGTSRLEVIGDTPTLTKPYVHLDATTLPDQTTTLRTKSGDSSSGSAR